MDRDLQLIRQLCDGQWHSGEDLAAALQISRAAVWKRLKNLQGYGLTFESRAGKGYRLEQPLELLDKAVIESHLPTGAGRRPAVEVLHHVDSTNRHMADAAVRGDVQPPAICFAEFQSAGRGRRGRRWQSPFGANLYASMLWRFDDLPPDLPALSLAVGVSVAEQLQALGFAGVGLKWPNDLLADGRKLGGILIEHRGETGGPCQVVVGLGLNVAMQDAQAGQVDQPWVSLHTLAEEQGILPPSRNRVAGLVSAALYACLHAFAARGFTGFQQRWAAFDLAAGQKIRLEQSGQWHQAEALGVDRDGALLVRMRGERQRFMSGEISLRMADDGGDAA